ncbi:MAG: flagellar protein FliS [Candidatus Latescibacterota bacterium]|jgi:flagellar protein FliS
MVKQQDIGMRISHEPTSWGIEEKTHLLLLLYQKALRCIDQAVVDIEAGQMVKKSDELIRAQDIVLQLSDALDHRSDDGGLTANLERLYLYVYKLLIKGNTRLDLTAIAEARKHLAHLYVAWEQAAQQAATAVGPVARARL